MRARSGTSLDAKRAREALMKELAALPVSDKARTRVRDAQRKADELKTGTAQPDIGQPDASKPDAVKPSAVKAGTIKAGAIRTGAIRAGGRHMAPIVQAAGAAGVVGAKG